MLLITRNSKVRCADPHLIGHIHPTSGRKQPAPDWSTGYPPWIYLNSTMTLSSSFSSSSSDHSLFPDLSCTSTYFAGVRRGGERKEGRGKKRRYGYRERRDGKERKGGREEGRKGRREEGRKGGGGWETREEGNQSRRVMNPSLLLAYPGYHDCKKAV